MMERIAPLSGGFMIAGIVGLAISIFKIWPWDKTWGLTMIVFSVILIVSSLISMTYADAKSVLKLDNIRLGGKK